MFTIGQVSRLLKVHSQTLRNWERQGLIIPQRIGQSRIYSDEDIRQCKQIKRMSGHGVQLQIIKEALKKKQYPQTLKGGEAA